MDLNLDPRDVEAVHRMVAAGVNVIACTGRPFPGALPWVRRLGLAGPIVCYQGAQIRTLDGGMVLDHGLQHDIAVEVIHFARERDLHVQAYRDDMLIVERVRPEAHLYAEHAGMDIHVVDDLDKAMGPTTPKLVIVSTAEKLDALLPEVRKRWAGRLNAATSVPEYLEFTSVESDKASALRFLCDSMAIDRSTTVAVWSAASAVGSVSRSLAVPLAVTVAPSTVAASIVYQCPKSSDSAVTGFVARTDSVAVPVRIAVVGAQVRARS